ncbi:MAG: acyl-CoA dehydrogenase [Burkholderiaceae bacterium]
MTETGADHRMLRDSARRFVEKSYRFEQRVARSSTAEGISSAHWRTFAELGWLALGLPEHLGGYGSATDQVVLAEELGRAMVVEPWLSSVALCAPLLVAYGRDDVVVRLSEGSYQVALAAWELQGRYDAFDVGTTAARDARSGQWVLDGRKTLVLGASTADEFLVLARIDGDRRSLQGLALFVVPARAEGLRVQTGRTYDGVPTGSLALTDVRVDSAGLLDGGDRTWPTVERAIDQATVICCAQAVGTMQRAFELTKDYVSLRKQFGRTVVSNQVVRHRLVDMYVDIEQARAITELAARSLDAERPERIRLVSSAKAFVSRAGRALGEQSVQLHGAVGMTDEIEVGHCYKRLAAQANLFGDESWHLERLAGVELAVLAGGI